MKDVIIIGAGIAGLSAGFELNKTNIDFQILETADRVGGSIETLKIDDYLIECGPNTFSSLGEEIFGLIKDLGIEKDLTHANEEAKKRYVYHNGHLKLVPTNPVEFFKTDLLTRDGKKTVLEELLIPKEEREESVEDFFTRRFGREVLKNLIQPFLNGVYAGDVKKLSASAVFPKLKELENKHKSIILGFILSKGFKKSPNKLTLYSFKEGLEYLPQTIYKKIKSKITLGVNNLEITRAKDCFLINFKLNNKTINYATSSVLFTSPAYSVLNFMHLFPNQNTTELFQMEYLPISTVTQVIDKSKLKNPLDGFGFLCTKEPHRKLLGTIWSSSVFPGRAPASKALLTSFIGGANFKKVTEISEDEIKSIVTKDLCETLHISDQGSLETIHIKTYPYAIPQYHLGHLERLKRVNELMDKNYGLFFTGNYLYGISINDTIKTSKLIVEKIKGFLKSEVKKQGVLVAK